MACFDAAMGRAIVQQRSSRIVTHAIKTSKDTKSTPTVIAVLVSRINANKWKLLRLVGKVLPLILATIFWGRHMSAFLRIRRQQELSIVRRLCLGGCQDTGPALVGHPIYSHRMLKGTSPDLQFCTLGWDDMFPANSTQGQA